MKVIYAMLDVIPENLEDLPTFNPYCSLAISGFSDMKVNTARLILRGSGMMIVTKTAISNMSSANT